MYIASFFVCLFVSIYGPFFVIRYYPGYLNIVLFVVVVFFVSWCTRMQSVPLFAGQFLCNSSGHRTIISNESATERKTPAFDVRMWTEKLVQKGGKCVDAYIYTSALHLTHVHVVHTFVYPSCTGPQLLWAYACVIVYTTYETPIWKESWDLFNVATVELLTNISIYLLISTRT